MLGASLMTDHIDMTGYGGLLIETQLAQEVAPVWMPALLQAMESEDGKHWVERGCAIPVERGGMRASIHGTQRHVRFAVTLPEGLSPSSLVIRVTRFPRKDQES